MANFKSVRKSMSSIVAGVIYDVARIAFIIMFFLVSPAFAQSPGHTLEEDMFYKINFGRADDVKSLLDKGANPNAISSTGEYALTVAIGRDDDQAEPMVRALLDKGANPNIFDNANSKPIVAAVSGNKAGIVADLIANGADYHVKAQDGRTLVEIASANHNQEILNMIQSKLTKEEEIAASLHSPERFKSIIRQYVMASCTYQYWSYVMSSRQNPDDDKMNQSRIDHIKADITTLVQQIQTDYPRTPTRELERVSADASQRIYTVLNDMVSNTNRETQGVGKEDDAAGRCTKIMDLVDMSFPPSASR